MFHAFFLLQRLLYPKTDRHYINFYLGLSLPLQIITFVAMLTRFTAFVLLAALVSSNCSRFFVYAGFELNKKYIAGNLCINKDRPWLHCNGKCYFMKKIRQAEENEKKQEAKDNLNKMEVSFFQEPYRVAFVEPIILSVRQAIFPSYACPYSESYIDTIFRPPKHSA